jgi:hypothetical protein
LAFLVPFITSALTPVVRPPPTVSNSDDLDMPAKHPIDDKQREAAQQKASGIADVRRRDFRSLTDQLHGSIELAAKARRRGLVALAVLPLCGLGFVGGQRVDFDRERRHQRAASRRRTSAQGMVLSAPLSSSASGGSPLLYRVSKSEFVDRFILKGAALLLLWLGETIRPTKDVDLLGLGDTSADGLKPAFVSLCAVEAPEDGLTFLPESVHVEAIREAKSAVACASDSWPCWDMFGSRFRSTSVPVMPSSRRQRF